MAGCKIPETCCSGYRYTIITWIGSLEQGYYEVFADVIRKKLYELVLFLLSYNLQKVEFSIRSD